MTSFKINWWGIAFLCLSSVLYVAGRADGRAAQIRESIPTEVEMEEYNKRYIEDMLKLCKAVWEEQVNGS